MSATDPVCAACGLRHPPQFLVLVHVDAYGREYWADAMCETHEAHKPCRACDREGE